MPNQPSHSRSLLLGIALLMLGAAIPDAELLLERAEEMRRGAPRTERIVLSRECTFANSFQ